MFPIRTKESGKFVEIELKLNDVNQLFNSLDPSPFIEKDLDNDAVDFIVSYFGEFDIGTKTKVVIHLPESQRRKTPEEKIRLSVRNFFEYMTGLEGMKIRQKLMEGRDGLLVGIAVLITSLAVKNLMINTDSMLANILAEGLTIGGWVAMWKPISNILYDWWPMRRQKAIYRKISVSPIEFIYK
jgi:hypothetical protein